MSQNVKNIIIGAKRMLNNAQKSFEYYMFDIALDETLKAMKALENVVFVQNVECICSEDYDYACRLYQEALNLSKDIKYSLKESKRDLGK